MLYDTLQIIKLHYVNVCIKVNNTRAIIAINNNKNKCPSLTKWERADTIQLQSRVIGLYLAIRLEPRNQAAASHYKNTIMLLYYNCLNSNVNTHTHTHTHTLAAQEKTSRELQNAFRNDRKRMRITMAIHGYGDGENLKHVTLLTKKQLQSDRIKSIQNQMQNKKLHPPPLPNPNLVGIWFHCWTETE